MKQQSIDLRNEFQPAEEEIFFDEETVQRIPAVVPLEETPTRTSARRFQRLRVPMRKEDKSFNPAFLVMALIAVTALGVIAGTMVYRTASEKSTNATIDTDEPVNRTIPAQYQFVVDKPESTTTTKDTLDKDNLSSLPANSDAAPVKKDSREEQESSSAPETENEQQKPAENEEPVEEDEPSVTSDEPPPPPPPPLRRDRKETKKQDKDKPKNDNAKSETQEEAPPTEESEESSEN